MSVGVKTGQNRGACGAAERLRCISVVEPDAGRCQLVQVRRLSVPASVSAYEVGTALIE
jgi:hypothetical protein